MPQYKGTTPTETFELPKEMLKNINLLDANHVYVSFGDADNTFFTKSDDDVIVGKRTVKVRLEQAETLRLPNRVRVQINYTYTSYGGQTERNCTDIHTLIFKDNMLKKVVE